MSDRVEESSQPLPAREPLRDPSLHDRSLREEPLRDRLARHGQEHVLCFWDRLPPAGRSRLAAELEQLDLEALRQAFERAHATATPPDLAPVAWERLPERGGDALARAEARARGEALLAEGRVAVAIVAGGQGTRLGFQGPKGTFPIGPVSGRTLFGLHAQRIRGATRRYGAALPWVVLTSPATDASTRAHFQAQGFFGLPEADVFFVPQSAVPCLDFEGRLMLAAADRLARAPDGHGGFLSALHAAGIPAELERRGVEIVSYGHVDNPLLPVVDPLLVGWHAQHGAEWTCKAVAKEHPGEKLGTLGRVGGRTLVVEYTELAEPQRSTREADGALRFAAGAIGAHAFDRGFLARASRDADRLLPWHASPKRIPTVDGEGRTELPAEPNGVKLERFVFDALPEAHPVEVLEIRREDEYAPVKNARGEHSPETARHALDACYRRWLEAANVPLPSTPRRVEVDHTLIDGPEDAERVALGPSGAGPIFLTATGVSG